MNSEISTTTKPVLAVVHYSKDKQNEPEATPASPEPPATETADAPLKAQTTVLLVESEYIKHSLHWVAIEVITLLVLIH